MLKVVREYIRDQELFEEAVSILNEALLEFYTEHDKAV